MGLRGIGQVRQDLEHVAGDPVGGDLEDRRVDFDPLPLRPEGRSYFNPSTTNRLEMTRRTL